MKLKLMVVAISMIATAAHAEVRYSNTPEVQEVRRIQTAHVYQGEKIAPIVNIVPIEHLQSFPQTNHVCRQESVPMYRDVPVTTVSETTNSRSEYIGTVVGAVIGAAATGGTSTTRLAGAVLGGSIGYAIGNTPSRTTTIHGYTTEMIGYRDIQRCEVIHGAYERKVVIGYRVTYDDEGVLKTITTSKHPGAFLRIQVQ